jgi:HK97 gp10 family phage protein
MARSSAYLRAPVTGLAELRETLRGISEDLQTVIVLDAVKAAAKPIERFAKMLAPRRTGALEASIGTVGRKPRNGGLAYALVGPMRGYYRGGKKVRAGASNEGADSPSHYAHLVEFGHIKATGGSLRDIREVSKVVVLDKNGRYRRVRKAGRVIEKAKGKIGGFVSPRPFMRPAAVMGAAASGAAMADGIRTGIEKAVRKHNRRAVKIA